jgi:hypothetical protein
MNTHSKGVKEALEKISKEDGLKYLDDLNEAWKEHSKDLGRSTLFYLLVVALFELLIGSQEDLKFTVAGFQFANSSVLQKALPAIAGYLFYQSIMHGIKWRICEDVFKEFYQKYYPDIYDSDLELLLKPGSGVWNVGERFSGDAPGQKFGYAWQLALGTLLIFVVPVAFAIHSAYQLINRFGGGDVLSLVSISVSGVLVLAGLIASAMK